MEYFDRGSVIVGGAVVGTLEGGRIELMNGNTPITTMQGYAGVAKGPLTATITAKRYVPRAGIPKSQDMHDAVINQKFTNVVVVTGGWRYSVTGVPPGLSRDFSVQNPATEDWQVHGGVEVSPV